MLNRWRIDISSPKLISTMAATKDKTWSGRDTLTPEKNSLVVQYNEQVNRAEIKSATLKCPGMFRGDGLRLF